MTTHNQLAICVSGGFDVLHVGHVRLLQGAVHFGRVVVILNSDNWLIRKKGYCLNPWHERKEMLLAIKGVAEVVQVDDSDDTVCEALRRIKPNVFGNGGLRNQTNTPERELCQKLGIAMVYGLGGGERDAKTRSLQKKIRAVK